MLRLFRLGCVSLSLLAALCGLSSSARAQIETDIGVEGATEVRGSDRPTTASKWWLGGYYRHLWIPAYMTEPFFDRAPAVTNDGFGLVATYRTEGSLNIQFGVGYMPYEFQGPFLADGSDEADTELVDSDLSMLHITGSLLWDIEFHQAVALEIGVGLDLGVLLGDVTRNEAYPTVDGWERCTGPTLMNGQRTPPSPSFLDTAAGRPFCDEPDAFPALTDPADKEGEHYDVEENSVPPVIGFPAVPHVALRLQPFDHLAIKAEFGFGIVQLWAGVSLHGSFGIFDSSGPSEVVVEPDTAEPVSPVPAPAPVVEVVMGRVLGKVLEEGTEAPVSGATVSVVARALSPLSTLGDGRFVVDRLDAGPVRFEIDHPEYASGDCKTEIPAGGGDVPLTCYVKRKVAVGAISGQIKTNDGKPIAIPIRLEGPRSETLTSNAEGVFAAVDLPVGRYRLTVDAEGYLLLVHELEIVAHDTALPELVLVPKPKRTLVKLKKKEIVITEQVVFKTGSAEITPESEPLMRAIADVMLRNPHVELVEVQGHTDNRGTRSLNMKLSQDRAESVRAWLAGAGVEPGRMEARGYGPDHPIRPNNTAANRAKNRRVQFIIRRQAR